MPRTILVSALCLMVMGMPLTAAAASSDISDSSYWAALIHEENSLVASVLYLPYMILQIPVGIIDGIINPKPTSQSSIPPPAHRSH